MLHIANLFKTAPSGHYMFLWTEHFYDVTKHALSRVLSGRFTVQVACLRYLGLCLNDLKR